jgi:GntR family transcriptional regulator
MVSEVVLKKIYQPMNGEHEKRLYLRAQQSVLEMIEGPGYAAGDKIPSERELSDRLGISRMTMRKAIDNLVKGGILERRSTSGTFVAVPRVERPLNHDSHSISEIIEKAGGRAGSKLLFFESAEANSRVAERLAIRPGASLIVIRRLRTVNDVPFCVETSHLPAERVPGLAAADLLENESLYALLKQRYGIAIGAGESLINVSPATALEAELLGLRPDTPAMIFRSVVRDRQGRPIEYLTSVNHPQRVVFKTVHDEKSS